MSPLFALLTELLSQILFVELLRCCCNSEMFNVFQNLSCKINNEKLKIFINQLRNIEIEASNYVNIF
ncbi:hypothetical protein T4E_5355 [Trichinella pseudospiralis]|uniref:Secreted protein n=1 Tax=Trichinella pseudospiralis TaxID=6337 RepID=A0A0V0XKF3_TRIPS|nr:hypothetical protein T4E_9719 [Trichinella pseudospiralis]KRX88460.1 hypothetical protein T4E_5355 [Trichinella pseudospiralis]